MKAIVGYLRTFLRTDFHIGLYLYVACFLAISIWLNYTYNIDGYIESQKGSWLIFAYYTLFFAIPYYGILIPALWVSKKMSVLRSNRFWAKSIGFLGVLVLVSGFYFHHTYIRANFDGSEYYFLRLTSYQFKALFLALPIVLIIKYRYDRRLPFLYGYGKTTAPLRPYFIMLLIMLPIILGASFDKSFIDAYPRYRPWKFIDTPWDINIWAAIFIFEISYGIDFLMTEFLYRGALALAMSEELGNRAVLPMVVVYCFIHFGKPVGETISSIFGGYILGVIAIQTRSIWGGAIIHLGIAYSMEFIAALQHWRLGSFE